MGTPDPRSDRRFRTTARQRVERIVAAVTGSDLVLAAIPLALTLGVVLGSGTPLPHDLGVAGGSILSTVAAAYSIVA